MLVKHSLQYQILSIYCYKLLVILSIYLNILILYMIKINIIYNYLSPKDAIGIDEYKKCMKRNSAILQPSTVSIGRQQLARQTPHRT